MMKNPLKIVVLVSGSGSNLQALIDKQANQTLNIQIVGVISNKADAYALTRANNANIKSFIIDKGENNKPYKRVEFEKRALAILTELKPDLVVLAGFMKILTPLFINGVNKELAIPMINLHPSILPHYKGLDTHKRVLQSGEVHHGCSVHLVTEELDAGQVLTQALLTVKPNDTAETLQQRVHCLEHRLLPFTLDLIIKGVLDIRDLSQASCLLPLPYCFYLEN